VSRGRCNERIGKTGKEKGNGPTERRPKRNGYIHKRMDVKLKKGPRAIRKEGSEEKKRGGRKTF